MKKARLGFIGVGKFIRENHLLTARDSDRMTIRAIADINESLLDQIVSRMEVEYTTTNYKDILADPSVDIVVIGTKQDLHARLIVESLRAGKWVFCEKPMSETEEETRLILETEKKSSGRLAIGFNRRFAPAYVQARRLMSDVKKPWNIYYRLAWPNQPQYEKFYHDTNRPHLLYEGCHVLDLVCWFLNSRPERVYMTGGELNDHCAILSFPDESQAMIICGSLNSRCLWKEYIEVLGEHHAITVSDFVDMRVRGFPGEFDRLFPPYRNEKGEQVLKYGFDFFEEYIAKRNMEDIDLPPEMPMEKVLRPISHDYDTWSYNHDNPDIWTCIGDKGWVQSFEHFVQCFLDGTNPKNANATAGALVTELAHAMFESRQTGQPVEMEPYYTHIRQTV